MANLLRQYVPNFITIGQVLYTVYQKKHFGVFFQFTVYVSGFHVAQDLFFIIESGIACFPCAVHVFNVQASSSPPRLPLCQISLRS